MEAVGGAAEDLSKETIKLTLYQAQVTKETIESEIHYFSKRKDQQLHYLPLIQAFTTKPVKLGDRLIAKLSEQEKVLG